MDDLPWVPGHGTDDHTPLYARLLMSSFNVHVAFVGELNPDCGDVAVPFWVEIDGVCFPSDEWRQPAVATLVLWGGMLGDLLLKRMDEVEFELSDDRLWIRFRWGESGVFVSVGNLDEVVVQSRCVIGALDLFEAMNAIMLRCLSWLGPQKDVDAIARVQLARRQLLTGRSSGLP